MKKVVMIGGGTGLSSVLRGIKTIPEIDLKVIVTVADSGGSTGDIRKQYNIPAVGDIRQIAGVLSENTEFFDLVMEHRFKTLDEKNTLHNHSLGNLFITSLIEKMNGNFYDAINKLSSILKINGEIIPITDFPTLTLKAVFEDGSIETHEHNIPNKNKKIKELSYLEIDKIKPNPRAIMALSDADYIIFSPGSLFTSTIANIIVPGIKEEIINNKKAKIIYISNIVTQPGESLGLSDYDHIKIIESYLKYGTIDMVVINNQIPEDSLLRKYKEEGYEFIVPSKRLKESHVKVVETSLLDNNNKDKIRHDHKKIKNVIEQIIKE